MIETYKGKTLGISAVRRMIQGIERAQEFRASGARSSAGLSGASIEISAPLPPEPNCVYCKSLSTVGQLELVEIEDGVIPGASPFSRLPNCWTARRPMSSRIGITQSYAVPGRVVLVQEQGFGLVKYLYPEPAPVHHGTRLGNRFMETLAYPCDGGPLQVVAVASHDPSWTGFNYALVRVGIKRLDNQFISYCNGDVCGNFEVMFFGNGWTLTEEQCGVVRCDLVSGPGATTTTTPTP